jgi:hypothetical protein
MSQENQEHDDDKCTDKDCSCHKLNLPHVMEYFKTHGEKLYLSRNRALKECAIYLADFVNSVQDESEIPDSETTQKKVMEIAKAAMTKDGFTIPIEVEGMFFSQMANDALRVYMQAAKAAMRKQQGGNCDPMPENMKDPLWELFKP